MIIFIGQASYKKQTNQLCSIKLNDINNIRMITLINIILCSENFARKFFYGYLQWFQLITQNTILTLINNVNQNTGLIKQQIFTIEKLC